MADKQIRVWLVEIGLADQAEEYATTFEAQGYQSLQDLRHDRPDIQALALWGITGRSAMKIINNLHPHPTQDVVPREAFMEMKEQIAGLKRTIDQQGRTIDEQGRTIDEQGVTIGQLQEQISKRQKLDNEGRYQTEGSSTTAETTTSATKVPAATPPPGQSPRGSAFRRITPPSSSPSQSEIIIPVPRPVQILTDPEDTIQESSTSSTTSSSTTAIPISSVQAPPIGTRTNAEELVFVQRCS